MGDEPYTTQQTTSSTAFKRSTNPRQAAYAAERAKVLFGSYRRGDANDPDAYVLAISAVLSSYDMALIQEVTDPRTGIAATEKYMSFMPNAGELKVYCDGVGAQRDRIQRLGALPAPDPNRLRLAAPPPAPGDKATVLVPKEHPRYAALVEWSKTADERLWKYDARGIWISWDTWDSRQSTARMGSAASGLKPLVLSEDARRAMAETDAVRNGDLPLDQPAYQEAGAER